MPGIRIIGMFHKDNRTPGRVFCATQVKPTGWLVRLGECVSDTVRLNVSSEMKFPLALQWNTTRLVPIWRAVNASYHLWLGVVTSANWIPVTSSHNTVLTAVHATHLALLLPTSLLITSKSDNWMQVIHTFKITRVNYQIFCSHTYEHTKQYFGCNSTQTPAIRLLCNNSIRNWSFQRIPSSGVCRTRFSISANNPHLNFCHPTLSRATVGRCFRPNPSCPAQNDMPGKQNSFSGVNI